MMEVVLLVFGIAAAAAAIEIAIFVGRLRRAARRENREFEQDVLDQFNYLESPDGMEQDLQKLLAEERSKDREQAMDLHPSTYNEIEYNIEMRPVIGYISETVEESKKKKKPRRSSGPPTDVHLKFWDFDK